MGKIITASEAARRLGLSDQTLRNWAEKGLFAYKRIGRVLYVSEDLPDQIGDIATDVEQARRRLEQIKAGYERELQRHLEDCQDSRREYYYSKWMESAFLHTGFCRMILKLMKDDGALNDRECELLTRRLQGDDLQTLSEEYGLSRERIRQITEKALRKSRSLTTLRSRLAEDRQIRADNQILLNEVRNLRQQLQKQKEEEAAAEKQEKMQSDELIQKLSTRLVECNLSTRALNCVRYFGIDTVGELAGWKRIDVLRGRNVGKKTVQELTDLLESFNLSFGMDIQRIYHERVDKILGDNA